MPGTTRNQKDCPICQSLEVDYELLREVRDAALRTLTSASANKSLSRYRAAVRASEDARAAYAAMFQSILRHWESHAVSCEPEVREYVMAAGSTASCSKAI